MDFFKKDKKKFKNMNQKISQRILTDKDKHIIKAVNQPT